MTLNQLVAAIQSLGDNHALIKKTFQGTIVDFLSTENLYPAMLFDVTGAAINGSQQSIDFEIYFMDRVAQDASNEMEILSDQLQTAQDIIAQMRNQLLEYELADNVNMTFFVDDTGDVLGGVRCDITINLGYIADRCAVPLNS
jgi:hypothetical protein